MNLVIWKVFFIVFLSSIGTEFLGWWFVYKKEGYIDARKTWIRMNNELHSRELRISNKGTDRRKAAVLSAKKKAEDNLKGKKVFYQLFNSFMLFGLIWAIGKSYGGVPVVDLPFQPAGFIRKLSQRGLDDNQDLSYASVMFIYGLFAIGIKSNLAKYLQWAPAELQTTSNWMKPPQQ